MAVKFSEKDINVERLSKKHGNTIKEFCSYEKELVDFLLEDAIPNEKACISATHLCFNKGTGKLMAYITLLADSLNLIGSMKQEFKEKGIHYKSLPALKIGRLCVDDRFMRSGIGTLLVEAATYIAAELVENLGCRFLTVDAKRNENKSKDSVHFYKMLGFKVLKERKKGTIPMYKDISKIIVEIRSQKKT